MVPIQWFGIVFLLCLGMGVAAYCRAHIPFAAAVVLLVSIEGATILQIEPKTQFLFTLAVVVSGLAAGYHGIRWILRRPVSR